MPKMKKKNYKRDYPDGINWAFWKNFVRPRVIEAKGGKCEKCGATKNLDLHHLDYKKEVSINTLLVLCRKCHIKEHKTNSPKGRRK